MKSIAAATGQTLFDIALQEMGSVEGVFDILEINPFLRLDMAIPAGTIVLVPDSIIKPEIVDYYTRNGIKPTSGLGEEVTLNEADMINIKQTINYDLTDGSTQFDGVRLFNLRGDLTVQVDYTALEGEVTVSVEQSLDGISFSPIEGASQMLDTGEETYTFNLSDLLTNYCRIKVTVTGVGGAEGTIDEIIWRV